MLARMVATWYHHLVSRGAAVKTLSLRIPDDGLARRLEQESRRRGTSINGLIVEAIRTFLGVPGRSPGGVHHDLDHLAGTWSETDEREFAEAVQGFATVDREMWE
jgi:predicted transcriptional regulator